MTDITFTDEITVELIKSDFDDKWPVFAAWTSTRGGELDAQDAVAKAGLINALMRDRHGSPFEHMNATFRVTAPIFVWREHHRHRAGFSYNEESGRYRQLAPVFYIPGEERHLVQVGKAMDYQTEPGADYQYYTLKSRLEHQCELAYGAYEEMLGVDIMREVARMCLPVNIMSTCVVTMNARSLMNFLSLRVRDDTATFPSKPQWEINLVALGYETMFSEWAPITHKAFVDHGRVAP